MTTEEKIQDIANRIKGVGEEVNHKKLLMYYISRPDEVPAPLVHEDLVRHRNDILRLL